ncbi:helix-turn-helix domain-containing protein [Oceanobacter sp. 3_MG-2023]|uniref:helix-turn-helix domain-containing protein n=1 Tax=Oceanobacter sp. 3_MG-2023 TaxID=3062622 RepID=UPI0027360948|nr:helix-turn-helix domain-containing protein [Oceanobacter sp. 3_MG-2023]MDP2506951.1 helix-turn-helix domain-containing protein [Oceanobacter sp. 3_MG-2023]
MQDASEQALVQDWLPISIDQVSSGRYAGRYQELNLPGIKMVIERQNCTVHKRFTMDKKYCTLSYVRGTLDTARVSEYQANHKALFLIPAGTEADVHVGGEAETVYFRFDQEHFQQQMMIIDPERRESPDTPELTCLETPGQAQLDQHINQLLHHISLGQPCLTPAGIERYLTDNLMMMLQSSRPQPDIMHSSISSRRRAVRLVHHVCTYLEAVPNADASPGIVDLCRETSVSERTLQYSFKTQLGMSPNTYLRLFRLNRVRALLLHPPYHTITVTEAAMRWHFLHLGRFARDYTALFGESPSSTLRRAIA